MSLFVGLVAAIIAASIGTVVGLADGVIQLRIADQVKIEVAKSAVAGMQSQDD